MFIYLYIRQAIHTGSKFSLFETMHVYYFLIGFVGIDQGQCEQQGCCWNPADVSIKPGSQY